MRDDTRRDGAGSDSTVRNDTVITRLLVANRGEIARRVFRTCRDLGIATVAVHSDADADMPYVADADTAVHLPGNTPAETYLDIAAVIDAASRSGADAVHPGYGFLSENAEFARAVIDAGLTWVGPDPASIEARSLAVDTRLARQALGFESRLDGPAAVSLTMEWYRRQGAGEDALSLCLEQIAAYESLT